MKFVNKLLPIFLLFFFPFLINASENQKIYSAQFPNGLNELLSPNKKFLLINKDPDENMDSHQLLLRYNNNGEKQKIIYTYYRHVFVEWSPDSNYISITDFKESTDTTCILYHVESGRKIDLFDKAIQTNESIANILKNEHAYLECLKWLSPSDIQIKMTAWGRNNPNGVENLIVFDINNGF